MKKPRRDGPSSGCTGKRRYHSQGDALDAARILGLERHRRAYLCPLCGCWHLTTAVSRR